MVGSPFTRIFQGQYQEIAVPIVDSNGDAVPLSDNVRLIKWGLYSDGELVLEKSYPASGITIPTPANGQFIVVISGTDTSALSVGDYKQQSFIDIEGKYLPSINGVVRISATII